MPTFLIQLLISFALKFGLSFIFKKFPGLQERFPLLWQILDELLSNVKAAREAGDESAEKQARRRARDRMKKECFGTACPTDTKGLD